VPTSLCVVSSTPYTNRAIGLICFKSISKYVSYSAVRLKHKNCGVAIQMVTDLSIPLKGVTVVVIIDAHTFGRQRLHILLYCVGVNSTWVGPAVCHKPVGMFDSP